MASLTRVPAHRPRNPVDDRILRQLATYPFLSALDMEVRWGVATATMARALARLRAAGLVERVPLGDDKTLLHVLTGDGIVAAAASAGVDLTAMCRVYGLDRRQLLARLPLLKRLVRVQRFIMELAHALEGGDAGRLGFYKSGPLHWHAAGGRGGRARGAVLLDGMGRIDVAAPAANAGQAGVSRGGGGRAGHTDASDAYWFGLLWDGDGTTPAVALQYQLDRLRALRADDVTGLPPILVVTAAVERLTTAGLPPLGVIFTTIADYHARGAFGARWVTRRRGGGTVEGSLPALLAAIPAARSSPLDLTARPQGRVRPGDALRLERRVTLLRTGLVEERPTPTGLLALALPRGVIGVLATIGSHPLFDARMIGDVTERNASALRDELGWLRALDLVQVYYRGADGAGRPRFVDERACGSGAFGVGERPVMTYALTRRGTHLLAARAGLPPATYRILHKKLDASPTGDRAGLAFALGNAAHTLAIQEVFVAAHAAVTRRAGALRWLWEWGCVVPLRDREEDKESGDETWEAREDRADDARLDVDVLRPDARLLATVEGVSIDVYVEVDRSTETHAEIAAKLHRYHRRARIERRRVEEVRGGEQVAVPPLTVAIVTTQSEERAVNLLQTAKDVARGEIDGRAVRVVVAHLVTVERWDLFGEMWLRDAYPDRPGPVALRCCYLVPGLFRPRV